MINTEPPWGPTGKDVYERTYRRTKANGQLETWYDTVVRVVDGNLSLVPSKFHNKDERMQLIDSIYNMKIMPAGRHLWMSGVPGRQFLFNCHTAGWKEDFTVHFSFTFDQLMQGGGVGANYSNRYIKQYKPIKHAVNVHIVCDPQHPDIDELRFFTNAQGQIVSLLSDKYSHEWTGATRIEDTREGWSNALAQLLDAFYNGKEELIIDVSLIRSRGTRIKTFGGTAAGPFPLVNLLVKTSELLSNKVNTKLTSLDFMLIDHFIAEAVVSGNVRRSARMAMKHWSDNDIFDFINCKNESQEHWSTNISVEIDETFFRALKREDEHAVMVYQQIVSGMLTNGEPGFFNRTRAQIGEIDPIYTTNPCVTGDTVIATIDGPKTFKSLAEDARDILVYAWHPETKLPVVRMMRRPHRTRENVEILEVEFDSGLKVRCTPDHNFYSFRGKKVQAKDLKINSSIRAWSMSEHRDGHLRVHGWNGEANKTAHQWVARMVYENFYGSIPDEMIVHHKNGNKQDNHISNLELKTVEEHNQEHYPERFANVFDGTAKNHKVIAIRQAGNADVYNGCVDDAHSYIILDPDPIAGIASGIVSANCGEIAMQEFSNCNLGHVNLDFFYNDLEGALEAHRLMTRYLIRATFGDVPSDLQKEILHKDRRIGVGHFGYQGWLVKQGIRFSESHTNPLVHENLRLFYKTVRKEAWQYSFQLRIPEPIKVTTVAPTGTIAKLSGRTEGIHPILFKYFINNIRFSTIDPNQAEQLLRYEQLGHKIEDDLYSANTKVVSFVAKNSLMQEVENLGLDADYLVEEAANISMADMLAVQAMYQDLYADNAVSFTINVPADKRQIKSVEDQLNDGVHPLALRMSSPSLATIRKTSETLIHYLPRLKGTTIMVDGSRPQSPYIAISKEEYINNQNNDSLIIDDIDEQCASGACPIK